MDLALALQILTLLPPLHFQTPEPPAAPPQGTGTLLVAACTPGETVRVGIQEQRAAADGTARFELPAQDPAGASYRVVTATGDRLVHGTLGVGELLSAVCD